MDEPELTALQEALMNYMSNLSEEYYSAGWLIDLEYNLWDVLQGNEKAFAAGGLKDTEIQRLRELSDACGGWIYFSDEPNPFHQSETFIPLEEWKAKFAKWKEKIKGTLPERLLR